MQCISLLRSKSPTRKDISRTPRPPALPSRNMAGSSLRVAGGQLIEGNPAPKRIVITEFPDAAAAHRWYNSPEYQAVLPIKFANSRGRAFIVKGT